MSLRIDVFMILALLAIVLVIGASLFYIVEKDAQEQVLGRQFSFWEALYWAFITATTIGYGDISPQTDAGRAVAIAVAVGGIASFTALIGLIANSLVEHTTRRLLGIGRVKMENHIVIIGWSKIVDKLIDEIRANKPDAKIVVVDSDVPPEVTEKAEIVKGDPLTKATLLKANIDKASYIVVSPKDEAHSVLLVLNARRLNRNARIIAMAFDEDTAELLQNAGADYVLPSVITASLMASFIHEPLVPQVIIDLASTTTGYVDIVELEPTGYVGLKYMDALVKAKKEDNMIIIALKKGDRVIINPAPETVIGRTDKLLAIKTNTEETIEPGRRK